MTKLQVSGFDEKQALEDILSALEYRTRKEEKGILDPILRAHGLKRMKRARLVEAIRTGPGFEAFFLDILKAVRPFSQMLVEIYTFLNSNKTTTSRHASKFLVQFEKAKAELEFDLGNFPRELLKTMNEVEVFGSIVELRFPDINLMDPRLQWRNSQTEAAWRAISPVWDGDFYGQSGFHRALSYAHTILSEHDPMYIERANKIARPILDRLAAICNFVEALRPPDQKIVGHRVSWYYMTGQQTQIHIDAFPAHAHIVRDPRAATCLSHPVKESSLTTPTQTVMDMLSHDFLGFAISLNLWEKPLHRKDKHDWLAKRLGRSWSDITPEVYLEFLSSLADEYTKALDRVAPIVHEYSHKDVLERFLEFTALPFWKYRSYLYELWTMVHVLGIAQRFWSVELKNVEERSEGSLEWILPSNIAQQPVATIGDESNQIYCWSQRKTYHPGTGAGLEPDLRLTKSIPGYHDIIIIENKDKVSPKMTELGEILDRYVGGTCAESIWLINYEKSPKLAATLKHRWPGRQIHIASNFRPGRMPAGFEGEIENILKRHLEIRPDTSEAETSSESLQQEIQTPLKSFALEATLTWKGLPRDLDLHAWIADSSGEHHIYYREKGSLGSSPYAELDHDHQQGDGQETVRIKRGDFKSVVIAVHNYSGDGSLSQSNAVLRLNLNGRTNLRLRVPAVGDGRWWHVVRLDGGENEIQVLHKLSNSPPL